MNNVFLSSGKLSVSLFNLNLKAGRMRVHMLCMHISGQMFCSLSRISVFSKLREIKMCVLLNNGFLVKTTHLSNRFL